MKRLTLLIGIATIAFISHAEARDATAQECLNELNKNKQAEARQHRYFERFQELNTIESKCEYFVEGIAYFKQLKKSAEFCTKYEPEQASLLDATAVEQLAKLTPELKKCSAQVTLERKCLSALDRVHPLQKAFDVKTKALNKEYANKEDKIQAGCEMMNAGLVYFKEFEKASRVCEPLDPEKAQAVYADYKTRIPKIREDLDKYCKRKPTRQGT